MSLTTQKRIAITGIGMVTPLGREPAEVLRRIRSGDTAAAPPTAFDAGAFDCPVCAEVKDTYPQPYLAEAKMARLMNRDAQLAVAAARLALNDAGVKSGDTYPVEDIALFGSTGLAGLPLREVSPLIKVSAGVDGDFDLKRFGEAGLKAVRPILSFKILSNMPVCFVSINENIQGAKGIYTPWEGNGAQAIEAGMRALCWGDARCALVGGCDVKTHEMAFASLQQQGLFRSWKEMGRGVVPGEGAAFMVLETEAAALARGARMYGFVSAVSLRATRKGNSIAQTRKDVLNALKTADEANSIVSSFNGDVLGNDQPRISESAENICPKVHLGDLFAAAAPLQVALAALLVNGRERVHAHCFGHGSTQAAFLLEDE